MLTGSVASEEVLEARLLAPDPTPTPTPNLDLDLNPSPSPPLPLQARLLELLLHEMSRYPGVVVLCCSSYDAYDAVYAIVSVAM